MRQAEFRGHISQSEWKRLRQRKPSAGLVSGVVAITLAWVFSAIGLGPSQLQFGAVQIGSGSSLPVKLTNRGMTEFHAASVALEGEDAKDFDVDTKRCNTVAVGESCALWVEFQPRKPGPKHARLVVRTNDDKEFSSEFTGEATQGKVSPPPPVRGHEDASPLAPVPPPTGPRDETPTPTQPPALSTSPVPSPEQPQTPNSPPVQDPFTAPGKPEFLPPPQAQPSINPPVRPPIVVPPPITAPSVTTFEPRTPELVPHLTMTPGTAKFTSSSRDGESFTSPAQTVVVRSDGTADIKQLRLSVTPAGVPFRYSTACRPYLARGQTCTVQVTFVPQDSRPHAGALDAYEGTVRLARVDLHGIRPAPPAPKGQAHLTMNPGTVQFSSSSSDREFYNSPVQTVVVRSDGTADLRQLNMKIDPPAAPFSYSSQCPGLLARGQSCTVQVRFAPRDSRQYAGTLNAYDGRSQMAAVSLRGVGKSPSQPASPPGKEAGGGNSQNAAAAADQGNGAYGVPPRGSNIGKGNTGLASQNSSSGVEKSPSQPTNPLGKGTEGGNSQNGTAVPGQGNGLYGVPPRGPFLGKAADGNANQVVPPTLSRDDVRVRNFSNRNGEPAPRPGNGMSQGNPAIGNGRAAPDYGVNNRISGAASGKPSSPVVQRPSVPPAPRRLAPPRGPGMPVQTSPRRRPPGR